MFKNKILVKATQSSSPSSFFLIPLSLPSSSSKTGSPLSVELETLSWKLSRKWRLACLIQPFEILVVCQKSQSDMVDRVVSEFVKFDASIRVGVEEEVKSGSLIAKAIEIGLRCVMLDHKWTCLGDNTFVKSTFGTSEERTNVCAVNVQVQSGDYDEIVFLVSPEALRFSRHQISDLICSKNVDKFEKKREVILESYNFSTACTTLPSLSEGYVIGLSKVLLDGEALNNLQELWSIKHGLNLKSNYFVAVQFSYGGCMNKTWFPSSFVLQGSGLTPVPSTIRGSKAMLAFESFTKVLEAWDFFGGGSLIAKEQSLIGNGAAIPTWEKATHNLPHSIMNADFICKDLLSALDFRTPKPDIGYFTEKNTLDSNKEKSLPLTDGDSKDARSTINEVQIVTKDVPVAKNILPGKGQTPLLVPSFTKIKRKTATNCGAQIRSKGENSQVKATQENCQSTAKSAKSQKNKTVLVSSPTECPPKSQSSTEAVPAERHLQSTQGNTNSTSARSVKPPKKNDATPDNKFTTDARIVLQADAPRKKSQNKKNEQVGEEGLATGKTKNSNKKETMKKSGVDAEENNAVTLGSNCLAYTKAVSQTDAPAKMSQSGKKKICPFSYIEESAQGCPTKAKAKQSLDRDEVTTKVLNCHKRGQLQSLTVADLKCFLSCKKAKVGGTKEELIHRVTGLLV